MQVHESGAEPERLLEAILKSRIVVNHTVYRRLLADPQLPMLVGDQHSQAGQNQHEQEANDSRDFRPGG
jgi:hypothetical protein